MSDEHVCQQPSFDASIHVCRGCAAENGRLIAGFDLSNVVDDDWLDAADIHARIGKEPALMASIIQRLTTEVRLLHRRYVQP